MTESLNALSEEQAGSLSQLISGAAFVYSQARELGGLPDTLAHDLTVSWWNAVLTAPEQPGDYLP